MVKVFWILSAAILVAALALWGIGTLGVRGDADELRGRLEIEENAINRLHAEAKKRKLVNEKFIEAAKQIEANLNQEKEEVKKVMASRDLNVGEWDWGKDPPPKGDDLAEIRQWLERQYKKNNDLLAGAKIIFPEGGEPQLARLRGEVYDWEDFTLEDRTRRYRDLIVMREICKALTEASAEVTYMVEKEKGGKPQPAPVTHEVDEMKRTAFGIVGRRGGVGRVERVAEKEKGGKPRPHREHFVTVKFLSHLTVVPDVMRRVERSRKVVFAVRSAVIRPPGQERGRRSGGVGARGGPTEDKHLRNRKDREAPVEAEITFGLFEFPLARSGKHPRPDDAARGGRP